MRPRRHPEVQKRPWYVVVVIVVAMAGCGFGAVLYADDVGRRSDENTERVIRESQQKWCGIVGLFDDTYKANPPQTPAGQRLAAEMTKLRQAFGCKDR